MTSVPHAANAAPRTGDVAVPAALPFPGTPPDGAIGWRRPAAGACFGSSH